MNGDNGSNKVDQLQDEKEYNNDARQYSSSTEKSQWNDCETVTTRETAIHQTL